MLTAEFRETVSPVFASRVLRRLLSAFAVSAVGGRDERGGRGVAGDPITPPPGAGCGDAVGILKIAAGSSVVFTSSPPAFPQAGGLALAIREGAPTATRTRDLPLRRRSLYPLSYQGLQDP